MDYTHKYHVYGIIKDFRFIFVFYIFHVLCMIPKESNSVNILSVPDDATFIDRYKSIRPSLKASIRAGIRNFSLSHIPRNAFINDFGPRYFENFHLSAKSCVVESQLIRNHAAKVQERAQVRISASAIRLTRSLGCESIIIQPKAATINELLAEDQESLSVAFPCKPKTKKQRNETAYIWSGSSKRYEDVMVDIRKILSNNSESKLTFFSTNNIDTKDILAIDRLDYQLIKLQKSDLCKSQSFKTVYSDGSPYGEIFKGLSRNDSFRASEIETESYPKDLHLLSFIIFSYTVYVGYLRFGVVGNRVLLPQQSKIAKINSFIRKIILLVILQKPDSRSLYWLPKVARNSFSSRYGIPKGTCKTAFFMNNIQTVIEICTNGFHISSSIDRFFFGPISKYEIFDLVASRICFLLWKASVIIIFLDMLLYVLGKLYSNLNLGCTVFDVIEEINREIIHNFVDIPALCKRHFEL